MSSHKEFKKDVVEKHVFPENCVALRAPELHGEIKSAIGNVLQMKDQYQIATRNQLGRACSALGAAITQILGRNENSDSTIMLKEVLELLCDIGRLMTDLHHEFSMTSNLKLTLISTGDNSQKIRRQQKK